MHTTLYYIYSIQEDYKEIRAINKSYLGPYDVWILWYNVFHFGDTCSVFAGSL